MKLFSICFIFFLSASFLVLAQDDEELQFKHKLGIKTGYVNLRLRDKVISTYLYTGGGIPLELSHSFVNDKFKTNVFIKWNLNDSINTRADILKGFTYAGDNGTFVNDTIGYLNNQRAQIRFFTIECSVLRQLNFLSMKNIKFYLGGGLNYYSSHKKFLTLFYTNTIYDKIFSINLMGSIEFQPALKHTFKFNFSIPPIMLINRNLALEDGEIPNISMTKWAFFSSNFKICNTIGYEYKFAKRWSLEASYIFDFVNVEFPRSEKIVYQSILGGINFLF